jgi:hypothetical protein
VDIFIETLVKIDSTDYRANLENSEVVAVHQEVPNQETEVETVGADEGRSEEYRPVVVCRDPTEKVDQGRFCKRSPCGTHGRGETTVGPGIQQWNKRPRRRKAATSEEGDGIRHDFRKIVELEIEKCTVGSSTGLGEVSGQTM